MTPVFLKLSCLGVCFFISGCITFTDYYVKPDASYEILPTGQEGISFDIKYKKIIIDLDVNATNNEISARVIIKNVGNSSFEFKLFETELVSIYDEDIQKTSDAWQIDSFVFLNKRLILKNIEPSIKFSPNDKKLFLLNLGSKRPKFNIFNHKPEKYRLIFKFRNSDGTEFTVKARVSTAAD